MTSSSAHSGGAAESAQQVSFRNLILIGARGSGKTVVGRELAKRLGWAFTDTDELIQAQSGRSIRDIFERDGEAYFRQLESAVLAHAARGSQQVIAVGGGAVLAAANRDLLRAAGRCVWLTASPEELYSRTQADPDNVGTRPALTDRSGLEEMHHLLARRAPLYAALSDHVVSTAGQSVTQVVEAVLAVLRTGQTTRRGG